MGKLEDDQLQEIIKAYQDGMTPTAIAEKFDIHKGSVRRIMRKNGIGPKVKRIDEQTAKFIVSEYTSGRASTSIAEELKIDGSTVCRILKRNGIEIRPAEVNKRTYNIEQDYFETIDTEDKAYFLGFLYADGCLYDDSNCIKIEIHPKDRDILERFSQAIYGFVKIELSIDKDKKESIRTCVYSKKMKSDLVALGCAPNKSFTITFPSDLFVPDNLIWHFTRGYFDGDGCISIPNPKRPIVDFSSSALFIQGLIPFLEKHGIKCGKCNLNKENNLSGNVQLNGFDNINNIYHLMYDNATIYLKRKFDIFTDFQQLNKDHGSKKMDKVNNDEHYGTTFIPTWNNIQLTDINVKKMTLEDQSKAAIFVRDYYREYGFPYPIIGNDEIIKSFTALKNADPQSIEKDGIVRNDNQSGSNIFKHFSPHFFEAKSGLQIKKPSIIETFNDDDLLLKTMNNRLSQGYHINGNMLRQGLSNSKLAFKGSIFNTLIAKFFYSKYSQEGDIIYDYSMGYGQRLLAALSLSHKIKYIGTDPFEKSYLSNQEIFNFFKTNIPLFEKKKEVEFYCQGSEDFCPIELESKVALAFSSPPYYSLEKYDENDKQAGNGSYVDFINQYWRKTVSNIDRMLMIGGHFILNVNDVVDGFNIGEDMTNVILETEKYELEATYKIRLTKNENFGGKVIKYEPIYVFKKR
jgi:hypothetical protein